MKLGVGVEREVILTTRDFCAVSWAKDGTDFRVGLVDGGQNERNEDWWVTHYADNYRHVFKPDEDEDCEHQLRCHDETEALSLILSLQRELNEALP